MLTVAGGGKRSDFNHKVDHIMTNAPSKIGLIESSLTGTRPMNGYWDSDHEGLFSSLTLP